ncbi:unnamed protein product [Stenotrophomonas maltophilia]|nr:unnamed protein product [Stenotrophomonas maltophilia]
MVSRLGLHPAMPEVGELGLARWRDPRRCLAAHCRGAFGGMPGRSRPAVYPYRGAGTGAVWNPAYRDRFDGRYVSDFTVFLKMGLAVGDTSASVQAVQVRCGWVKVTSLDAMRRRIPVCLPECVKLGHCAAHGPRGPGLPTRRRGRSLRRFP